MPSPIPTGRVDPIRLQSAATAHPCSTAALHPGKPTWTVSEIRIASSVRKTIIWVARASRLLATPKAFGVAARPQPGRGGRGERTVLRPLACPARPHHRRPRTPRHLANQAGQVRHRAGLTAIKGLGYASKAAFIEQKLYLLKSFPEDQKNGAREQQKINHMSASVG